MSKKRLTIGLFICHLDNDYAYDICKGVDYAAKELDINLVIFPGMYINAAYNDPANAKYDYQYNSIFYYAKPESIDALIISIGTIGTFLNDADSLEFLNRFKDIPVLTLEAEFPGFSSLVIDSAKGLREVIHHLIYDHNKKHIGFISGRQGNADAQERLDIYRSTLKESGIPVDETLIAYGNFSEYCEDLVEDLLDTHPEIDALCFANDQMALGGYNVLKRRGIEIGKDIAVTGFDDVPLALALSPALTTVRANACELGYRSVYQVCELIQTHEITSRRFDSSMIVRDSCGCAEVSSSPASDASDSISQTKQDILNSIIDSVFVNDKDTFIYKRISVLITDFLSKLLDITLDPAQHSFPQEPFKDILLNYCNSDMPLYYSVPQLSYCMRNIEKLILPLLSDLDKKISFFNLTSALSSLLLNAEDGFRYNENRDYKLNNWTSSYIIRDTIINSTNTELIYQQIADKFEKLNLLSSYIFTAPSEEIHLNPDGSWHVPDALQLQVYNKDHVSVPLTKSAYMVDVKDLFNNPYIPQNRRYTMVLTPIFTSDEHHGVFLCELDISNFHHIYSISLQLGTTLKFLKMNETQQQTNQQLEYTLSVLHEKNRQLSKISTIDELTGLKNRRGFLAETQAVISSSINEGQRAILLFADMDNLKIVNDTFGHEDGDFALRTIATALKSSLRNGDIIGRIGGDEFVAFALLNCQQSADLIANRIHKRLADINANSDKPYYVEASIGIVDFICHTDLDIQTLIKQADDALYENKSHKRASVLKEDFQ